MAFGPCAVCHTDGCTYLNHLDYDGHPAKLTPAPDPEAASPTFTLRAPIEGTFQRRYRSFLQASVNRRAVGLLRYGPPTARQKYMTRMGLELEAYRTTGNQEHLYNIANYAALEFQAPEHSNSHLDTEVESATRSILGGNIA